MWRNNMSTPSDAGAIEFSFHWNPERGCHGVYVHFKTIGGKMFLAKPIKFEFDELETKPGTMSLGPTFYIDYFKGFAESVFNEAERNGLKPDSQAKIEGKLVAVEGHLSDMRQITKHLLKIKPDSNE